MPGLIPLVLQLVPALSGWLFGSRAAATTAAVASVAEAITGTAEPAAQLRALQDPDKASAFQVELAKIAAQMASEQRTIELGELQAHMADLVDARGTMAKLAAGHSPIAWGAPIISFIVLGTFGAMLGCLMTFKIPDSALALSNVMLGTLAAMATQAANYWLGSSSGSAQKSQVIAEQSRSLAVSTPPAG